jgi:hypothetical protein
VAQGTSPDFDRWSATERREHLRRGTDRLFYSHDPRRTAAAAALSICGGLAGLYIFFAAIGAVDLGDAVVATAVAVGLGVVWFAGFWYRHRRGEEALRAARPDRERRGF